MVSPHPTTMQIVAEQARRERLEALVRAGLYGEAHTMRRLQLAETLERLGRRLRESRPTAGRMDLR